LDRSGPVVIKIDMGSNLVGKCIEVPFILRALRRQVAGCSICNRVTISPGLHHGRASAEAWETATKDFPGCWKRDPRICGFRPAAAWHGDCGPDPTVAAMSCLRCLDLKFMDYFESYIHTRQAAARRLFMFRCPICTSFVFTHERLARSLGSVAYSLYSLCVEMGTVLPYRGRNL